MYKPAMESEKERKEERKKGRKKTYLRGINSTVVGDWVKPKTLSNHY